MPTFETEWMESWPTGDKMIQAITEFAREQGTAPDKIVVEFGVLGDYDHYYGSAKFIYTRPETPEEIAQREANERARKEWEERARQEGLERQEYWRLALIEEQKAREAAKAAKDQRRAERLARKGLTVEECRQREESYRGLRRQKNCKCKKDGV